MAIASIPIGSRLVLFQFEYVTIIYFVSKASQNSPGLAEGNSFLHMQMADQTRVNGTKFLITVGQPHFTIQIISINVFVSQADSERKKDP